MADQITDNRILVASANSVTGDNGGRWDTLSSTSETLDTDVKIQGTGSIGEQVTSSARQIIWDAGSTQNWANNVFYVWINCGIVGLLDLKANGGFAIRFTGPNANNFFEFYVGGSDSWPTAIEGGWVQFVVDIEATASNTGGTPPLTSAIQGVGWSAVTAGTMTKVSDNTWIDEIRRLPDGTPGIIIEGRNGGTVDWNFEDINTQLTNSAGTFIAGAAGSWVCNTPIQWGINDTSTHGFSDTNQTILWAENEFAPSDLLKLSALGNSGGTTNLTLGIKTGTGNNATGAQGVSFEAESSAVRFDVDFNDPNLDSIGIYGSSFSHAGAILMDDAAVSVISTTYLDCTSALVTGSEQLRVSVVAPNTADGAAFMSTTDFGDIVLSSFEFSDGHGLEILSGGPASQSDIGNTFIGAYLGTPGDNLVASSGSTDAMVYNNSGAAKTINGSDGATTPSFRNGASATSDYENNVSITVTDLTAGSVTSVYLTGTSTLVQETLNSGTTFVFSVGASVGVDIVGFRGSEDDDDFSIPFRFENVSFSVSQNFPSNQQINLNAVG